MMVPVLSRADVHFVPVEVLFQDGSREFGYLNLEESSISGIDQEQQKNVTLYFVDSPKAVSGARVEANLDFDYMDYTNGILEVSCAEQIYRLKNPTSSAAGDGINFYPEVSIDEEGYFEKADNPRCRNPSLFRPWAVIVWWFFTICASITAI